MKTVFKEPCQHCNGTGEQIDQRAYGQSMRLMRLKSGKTLRETAIRMGFSAVYLSDLELGRKYWRTDLIKAFIKALM